MPTICRCDVVCAHCRGRAPQLRLRAGARMFGQEGTQSGLIQSIEQMQTGKTRGFNEIAFLSSLPTMKEKGARLAVWCCVLCSDLAVSRTDSIGLLLNVSKHVYPSLLWIVENTLSYQQFNIGDISSDLSKMVLRFR